MIDYISRQEAIKSLLELTTFKTKRELVKRIESSIADENGRLGGVAECMDEIEDLPSEDVIPVSWIEEQIKWLRGTGNEFASLTAVNISSLLKTWRDKVKDG